MTSFTNCSCHKNSDIHKSLNHHRYKKNHAEDQQEGAQFVNGVGHDNENYPQPWASIKGQML